MKKPTRIHQLDEEEFAELKAGAEEALAHAQGKKLTLRARSVLRPAKPTSFTPTRIRSIRMRMNVLFRLTLVREKSFVNLLGEVGAIIEIRGEVGMPRTVGCQ